MTTETPDIKALYERIHDLERRLFATNKAAVEIERQLAEAGKDVERYKYLSQLADWSDIEALCRRCPGTDADEFSRYLGVEIDRLIKENQHG